jgi:gluconokinase
MIVVVMGVSGSGKSTVGRLLAVRLGWPFFDADDYHPPGNIEKMRAGQPLTDDDRAAWLRALTRLVAHIAAEGRSAVLSCSALKRAYRDQLRLPGAALRFVFLRGSFELISERLARRKGHYMPADLLASQFEALEEPADGLAIDIARPPEEIVEALLSELSQQPRRQEDER